MKDQGVHVHTTLKVNWMFRIITLLFPMHNTTKPTRTRTRTQSMTSINHSLLIIPLRLPRPLPSMQEVKYPLLRIIASNSLDRHKKRFSPWRILLIIKESSLRTKRSLRNWRFYSRNYTPTNSLSLSNLLAKVRMFSLIISIWCTTSLLDLNDQECEELAIEIGKYPQGIDSIKLVKNRIGDVGLKAILDGL